MIYDIYIYIYVFLTLLKENKFVNPVIYLNSALTIEPKVSPLPSTHIFNTEETESGRFQI